MVHAGKCIERRCILIPCINGCFVKSVGSLAFKLYLRGSLNMYIKAIAAIAMAGSVFGATAATLSNQTITKVGSQGTIAYMYLATAPSPSCLYSALYLRALDTAAGKSLYANLLAGYGASKTLARVDYIVEGDGTCTVNLLEF